MIWSTHLTSTPSPADSKVACESIMCLLRGPRQTSWGTKDSTHRKQARKLGIFPEIWSPPPPAPADTPPPPPAPADGPPPPPAPAAAPVEAIPWHLTKEQIDLLERRMSRIMWPHYMERLYYRGASPWKKPGRSWKCRRKYRLLRFLLPVQLRDDDMVPALRAALVLMAWAIRRLQGQSIIFSIIMLLQQKIVCMKTISYCSSTICSILYYIRLFILSPVHSPGQVYCFDTAIAMGILPGSRGLRRSDIEKMSADLIRALVLLAGSVIITYLVPIFHHFVHYGEYTLTHGMLRIYWMMVFERYVCHTHCAQTVS